ncbi:F-box only protein 6 isoform X1 [Nannospalax galili]|uniref:F-box only protein 6 isoform X1 n=1 Tax=Nannospalax galili TaxID=1026970 RepID=UPI0004ED711E|nr:F-box only protein 6 isoform X1 [Nannospalax galili]
MVSINELPENILLELFTHVPAQELLLNCRPVCSLWRDLIDVVTLWKRKSLREGFITKDWDQPVADWKIFYFLCRLRRNLLRNPCGEEDMRWWRIDSSQGNGWKVESLPGDHGTNFPDPKVKKYFVTSFDMCLKSQMVDLKAEGYWEELLDTFRPDIVVKDWSPTPSPTTLQGFATSSFNTVARTPSSGQAGMGPVSPTAASSSATGQPRSPPLPAPCRCRDKRKTPRGPSTSPDIRHHLRAIRPPLLGSAQENFQARAEPYQHLSQYNLGQTYQLLLIYSHTDLTFCCNKCFQ